MPDDSAHFAQLLRDARRGDSIAMGQLLESFHPLLLRFAASKLAVRLQAKIDPDDLVQAVFHKACIAFAQFRGDSAQELQAWLLAFLTHGFAHLHGRYCPGSKRDVGLEENQAWTDGSGDPQAVEPQSLGTSPSDEAQMREWDAAFRLAVSHLSEDMSEVLCLRILEGLSFVKMEQRLGISANNAQKRYERAIDAVAAWSPEDVAFPPTPIMTLASTGN